MTKTIRYELSRHRRNEGNSYHITRVFENGHKLLWARYLLRQQAIGHLRNFALTDHVGYIILPGVFKRR